MKKVLRIFPAALCTQSSTFTCVITVKISLSKVWLPQHLGPHLPPRWLSMNSVVVLLLETKLKGWMRCKNPHALPVLTPQLQASVLFASSEMWNQSLSGVLFYRAAGPWGESLSLSLSLPLCAHGARPKWNGGELVWPLLSFKVNLIYSDLLCSNKERCIFIKCIQAEVYWKVAALHKARECFSKGEQTTLSLKCVSSARTGCLTSISLRQAPIEFM